MQKKCSPIKPAAFGKLEDPVRDRFGAYRDPGRKHAGIDIYEDEKTEVKASRTRAEAYK